MKVDILAFGAHPDDIEISCAGALLKAIADGQTAAVVDLTRGELGTRGSAELRLQEAEAAAKILGLSSRENLSLQDGFISNDESQQMEVIKAIRKYQPEVVLANAVHDRHPDHGESSRLVRDACFKAGLAKIETGQDPWRPKRLHYYIQDRLMIPNFVIDISDHWEKKLEALRAYKSQFHDPDSKEPETYISSEAFWKFLEARAREMGHLIGAEFGEGFISEQTLELDQIR